MTENIAGSWKTDDTATFTLFVFEFPEHFKYFNLLSVNYYRALWGLCQDRNLLFNRILFCDAADQLMTPQLGMP